MLSLSTISPQYHLLSRSSVEAQPRLHSSNSTQVSCRPSSSPSPPLATLRADEHVIQLSKFGVKRYGAGWLRPPGITKTLQFKLEEAQEQLEQMEMHRRDTELREQEAAAQRVAMANPNGEQDIVSEQESRDLDAEVPDAEHEDLSSDREPEYTSSVGFHGSSLLQQSPSITRQAVSAMDDAELDGRLQDGRDLGVGGDLADDAPDVGSYEHTDTEQEDDCSDEDESENQSSRFLIHSLGRSDGRARRSLLSESTELLANSSFMESSPTLSRRVGRSNNAEMDISRNAPRD